MSDVSVEDGSVTPDFGSSSSTPMNITQTVNQVQDQNQAQQQQQQAPGFVPVLASPTQVQFLGAPAVIIPAASHTQAQALLAQFQALLGL